MLPQRAVRDSMIDALFRLNRDLASEHTAKCQGGFAMEVVVAQYWNQW